MQERSEPAKWRLWLQWMLANAIGQALGGTLGCCGLACILEMLETWDDFVLVSALAGLFFGATLGAALGLMQSLVLEKQGIEPQRWFWASVAGGALA